MREFGCLPRPISRFQRPRGSWFRRVLQAVQLRLGFLLVYALVGGFAFYQLWALGRSYGYFYSVRERGQIWGRFPDRAALATLEQIYGSESAIPEIRLARQVDAPFIPNPTFPALLKDPMWAAQARLALASNLDSRLSALAMNMHYFRFEELLAASENGRLLTLEQRRALDQIRRQQVEWYVKVYQPADENDVEIRRFKMLGWYRLPGPLESAWRAQILAQARKNQLDLLNNLYYLAKTGQDALPLLRRLQLQVGLAGLAPRLAGQLEVLARRSVSDCIAHPTDQGVILVAHYKRLLPQLDLSRLTPWLNTAQLNLLGCLREVTSVPH
jgi:hypothetical protein